MRLVNDNDLIFEVDVQGFSRIVLQQQVVGQGDQLVGQAESVWQLYRRRSATHLSLLDGSPCRVIRADTSLSAHYHNVLNVLHRGLASISDALHEF